MPSGGYHEMVWIPEGEFEMGGAPDEGGVTRRFDEQPKHKVYLDGYFIDRLEVTNNQYRQFMQATGGAAPIASGFKAWEPWFEATLPVPGISWFDARDYCGWVGLRLPTEAEWEKAARGTDARGYPWGNDPQGCLNCRQDEGPPVPVGTRPTDISPYGVLDMGFNVKEWVADWYDPHYYQHSPYRNPKGPDQSVQPDRVARGGSYGWDAFPFGSVTGRSPLSPGPEGRPMNVGLRCARDEFPAIPSLIHEQSWGQVKGTLD